MPGCKWKILALNSFSTGRSVFLRRGKSDNSLAWLIRIWCKIFRGCETRRLEKFIFARILFTIILSLSVYCISKWILLSEIYLPSSKTLASASRNSSLALVVDSYPSRIGPENLGKPLDSSRWMSAIIAVGEKFSTRGVIVSCHFHVVIITVSDLVD